MTAENEVLLRIFRSTWLQILIWLAPLLFDQISCASRENDVWKNKKWHGIEQIIDNSSYFINYLDI